MRIALIIVSITLIAVGLGGFFARQGTTPHLQVDTVAAGVCTIEGGGKTFMVIDVTKEMSGEPTPEEVEGPKNEEVKP